MDEGTGGSFQENTCGAGFAGVWGFPPGILRVVYDIYEALGSHSPLVTIG